MRAMTRLYLDHNATTPPLPQVVEAMGQCLARHWGNPSSTHAAGEEARTALGAARAALARLLGARDPRELLWTSGGTEAIQTAVLGVWRAARTTGRDTLVATEAEHAATLRALEAAAREGARVVLLPVDAQAQVDRRVLSAVLDARTALVSLILANNETGTLLEHAGLGAHVRASGALLHVDAVQALGRVPLDVRTLDADLVSVSAHKLHGPKGVGALWIRAGTRLEPLLAGSQEAGRRGGTENLPGIVGFGCAADAARLWLAGGGPAALAAVRDRFEATLQRRLPAVRFLCSAVPRLPNTSSVLVPGVDAELLLACLDAEGVCVSAGSACNAARRAPSPVLSAMGLAESEARRVVRVSFSRFQTEAEAEAAAGSLVEAVQALAGRPAGMPQNPS